jgi:4-amino-4-deoxy-L-arabinose transferase-like glycosyltransferase
VLLALASGGYGYHRDELYFTWLGAHPAAGYIDQPPLAPLLAGLMDRLGDGSLPVLRAPAAVAGGLVVLVTGLIARELGGRRGAQALAAGSMACAAILFAGAHLATTTVYDLLGWTVLSWLVIRALRDGGPTWLLVGVTLGVALENKTLILLLVAALLVGILVAGPRRALASRWPWFAALVALALWAPNIWWQVTHGLPQLEMSRQIASGTSGTSEPRAFVVPMQLVLVSPFLAPVWLPGLWRLARDPRLRLWRAFAVAYPVVIAVVVVTGGKSYYVTGLYPVLLAAGAVPVAKWLGRQGRAMAARVTVGLALVLSIAVNAVLFLPVLPADRLTGTPVLAIDYDAGEQVGWPELAAAVAAARDTLPADRRAAAVALGRNYGEAGAVHRFLAAMPAYSGHNSLYALGPPPPGVHDAIVLGYPEAQLRSWFTEVQRVGTVQNAAGVDNDEQGRAVWRCSGPTAPWSQLWPQMRQVG